MTIPSTQHTPSRRGIPVWIWIMLGLGGLTILAVCAIIAIGILTLLGKETTTTDMVAADGQSRVTVPGTWSVIDDLNDVAELQVGNLRLEQYLIVITENKADFADTTLADYMDLIRTGLLESVSDPLISEPRSFQINSKAAIQYRIEGVVDNLNIVYWLTAIEGSQNYYQIVAWTISSKAEGNEGVFQQVIESFEEISR